MGIKADRERERERERERAANLHEIEGQGNKVMFPPNIFCSPLLELGLFFSDDRVTTESKCRVHRSGQYKAVIGWVTKKQNHSQNLYYVCEELKFSLPHFSISFMVSNCSARSSSDSPCDSISVL